MYLHECDSASRLQHHPIIACVAIHILVCKCGASVARRRMFRIKLGLPPVLLLSLQRISGQPEQPSHPTPPHIYRHVAFAAQRSRPILSAPL